MAKKKTAVKEEMLDKGFISKLATVGITGVTTEEQARSKMIAFLAKNEIEDCEEDSTEDLFAMVDAMYDGSDEQFEDVAEEVEEEEEEEKPTKAKKVEEDFEDEEDDFEDDVDEEEDEESDEELEQLAEEEEISNNRKQKYVEKTVKTKEKKVAKIKKETTKEKPKSVKFDPKNNEEDRAVYQPLIDILDEKGSFSYNFIQNGGMTVKVSAKNTSKVFFAFNVPKQTEEGLIGQVYSPLANQEETLLDLFGDIMDLRKSSSNIIVVKEISLAEIIERVENNWNSFQKLYDKIVKKDEKQGERRQKMEDDLKSSRKTKATTVKETVTTKKKKVQKEDVVEEEKPTKATVVKKDKKSKKK